ncbi:MAG: kelch repeat-containing protein [bacterium]
MKSRSCALLASLLVGSMAGHSQTTATTPTASTIELAGRMRVARSVATATAIGGHRMLIAGGMTEGGGALREFEIFDASTNRIVASGDMDRARHSHSATRLRDGRVLILGGYDGSYLKSAAIFDPRTGRFSDAGAMNVGRSGHTATLLHDGTVLIVGGVGDRWSFLSSAEVYDPRTRRFVAVAPMNSARESHTATLLPDGRVMIAGGHRDRRENIVVYASTEVYDPARRRFSAGPMLTTARHKHEAVALADGRILVLGGSDPRDRVQLASAEVYDAAAHAWVAVSPMRAGRYKVRDTAVRLPDGRVLVAGSGQVAELFDPGTNIFSPVSGRLDQQYEFASAALLDDGHALVLGGYDRRGHSTDGIWRFRE